MNIGMFLPLQANGGPVLPSLTSAPDPLAGTLATSGPADGPAPAWGTLARPGADPLAGTLSRPGPDPLSGTLARP
jgi:hypothetical protein